MALTKTFISGGQDTWGKHLTTIWDLTGDTSYPSNGYSIVPQSVGLSTIREVHLCGGNAAWCQGGYMAQFDKVNSKIVVTQAGAEVSGNISTLTWRMRFVGD